MLLRKEIELKDAALSDYEEVRDQKRKLEISLAAVTSDLEESRRANHAFLLILEAARENKTDAGNINIAEEAIQRIIQQFRADGDSVSTLAATVMVQTKRQNGTEPPPVTDDK